MTLSFSSFSFLWATLADVELKADGTQSQTYKPSEKQPTILRCSPYRGTIMVLKFEFMKHHGDFFPRKGTNNTENDPSLNNSRLVNFTNRTALVNTCSPQIDLLSCLILIVRHNALRQSNYCLINIPFLHVQHDVRVHGIWILVILLAIRCDYKV